MANPLAKLFVSLGMDASPFEAGIKKLGGTSAAIGTAIGAGLGTAAAGALKLADEYDAAMDSIRIGTGASGEALAGLEAQFKAVGGRVTDDIGVVAQVIADLNTRTGQTGDGLGMLAEQMLDLSRMTGTDAVGNVASLTRMFGDWSIATEDQAESLDQLFRVSQATGQGIDALSQQVVQFGAPLRNIGYEFEEAIALLGKWEREGVNTGLALGGLKIALGEFAKEGIDAKEGLADLVDQIVNAETAAEAMALGVGKFGSRAGPDMVAAIREGRFAFDDFVVIAKEGSDTIAGLSDETRDLGDGLAELKNQAKLAIGPIVKDLAGIGEELGNAIYLLPVLVGALGRTLGKALGPSLTPVFAKVGAATGLTFGKFFGLAAAGAIITILGVELGRVFGELQSQAKKLEQFPEVVREGGRSLQEMETDLVNVRKALHDLRVTQASGGLFGQLAFGAFDLLGATGRQALEDSERELMQGIADVKAGLRAEAADPTAANALQAIFAPPVDAIEAELAKLNDIEMPDMDQIPGAVDDAFTDAVKSAKAGFGRVKDAFDNAPSLIPDEQRMQNMKARLRKFIEERNRSQAAGDTRRANHFERAIAKQEAELESFGRKTNQTWSGIRRRTREDSTAAADIAIRQSERMERRLADIFSGLARKTGDWGAAATMAFARGLARRTALQAIEDNATTVMASVQDFMRTGSPTKKGPGSKGGGPEGWGKSWGTLFGKGLRSAHVGADLSATLSPRLAPVMAGGGGGAVHIHVGTLIADEGGIAELRRRMDRQVRLGSRARRLYSETE